MKRMEINGVIVNDNDKSVYEWFEMSATCPKDVKEFLATLDGSEPIQVAINSQGGSVFAGSEIYTLLKSYQGEVEVVVTGLAASIASVIMMAGDKIKMSPTAQVMIHNASMVAQGDYRDLAHASEVIENTSVSLADLYQRKTGKTIEEVRELMDKETFFTAERALAIGLVDEILFMESAPAVVASFGAIFPQDKIMELKASMEQSEQLNILLVRIEALESKLEQFEKPSTPKAEEEAVQHDVLADYLFY